MNQFKEYLFLYLKGAAMGAADVVPGVSGGTIAFIAGIYEQLIESIKSISFSTLLILKKDGFKAAWDSINGTFLLTLGLGVITSLVSLAHVITYLLETYPEMVWSFFFGLIIASSLMVKRMIRTWNLPVLGSMLVGAAVAYWISVATPAGGSDNFLFIFFSGAVAICAMILPGISGAFILLLLGMYTSMIEALKSFDVPVVTVFVSGCGIGLLAFSRVLSWMFKNYHNETLSLLMGFMLGSLNKVWPWKLTLKTFEDHHGKLIPIVQENISPLKYETLTLKNPYLYPSVALMVFAIVFIFFLEKIGAEHKA
ncbi:MAG: DUF368 domain-containing protein [Oligoflexales bacterium]|nr:DUF368 domain-containing protein [Oligoflexales bacterium]